jgi:hypothetical protein
MQLEGALTQHWMLEGPAQYPATEVPPHSEVARQCPEPLGVEHEGAVQHLMSLDPKTVIVSIISRNKNSNTALFYTRAKASGGSTTIATSGPNAHTHTASSAGRASGRIATHTQIDGRISACFTSPHSSGNHGQDQDDTEHHFYRTERKTVSNAIPLLGATGKREWYSPRRRVF